MPVCLSAELYAHIYTCCVCSRILLKKYKRHGGNTSLLPSTDVPGQIATSSATHGDSSHGRERPLHKVKGQLCVCACQLLSWCVLSMCTSELVLFVHSPCCLQAKGISCSQEPKVG